MSLLLDKIRIVLVHTTHPGNIGAVARAMKTMGLQQLYLVKPKYFPDPAATARAKQADDILNNAVVVETLAEALADCSLVVGTSARIRSLNWPILDINEIATTVLKAASQHCVAIVFGSERTGLTNEEIQLCDYQVNIPANPTYSSLNLASAVQIIAYEIYKHHAAQVPIVKNNTDVELANHAEIQGYYDHLEQVLIQIGYLDPAKMNQIMLRLKRLYGRVGLEKIEINVLRGILTAIEKTLSKF